MAISDNRIKNQKIIKFTNKSLAFYNKHLLVLIFLIVLVCVQSFRHNAKISSFFVEISGSVYSTSDKITGAVRNTFSELKFLFSNLASLQNENIKLQDENFNC